jgi:LysM repeat protein
MRVHGIQGSTIGIFLVVLVLSSGCTAKPPAGTGTPESRAQAATMARDRELELTTLRAEMAATRIAGAKKEAELQELRDLVTQLRQENAESRQSFIEMREQAEQRQGELEKLRSEQDRLLQTQTTNHLSLLKDTVATLAQELGQLRQDLTRPSMLEQSKSSRAGPSKPKEPRSQEPRPDQPKRLPSALRDVQPSTAPVVRTVSDVASDKPPTITVQPGETLWSLATQHHTSVAALREVNKLEGEALFVGQVLILPAPSQKQP